MKLPAKAKLMLREARDLIDRYGALVSLGQDAPTVRCVTRPLLRSRLIDRGWFSEGHLCVGSDGETKLTKAGFTPENNFLTTLKSKGFVSFNRDHAWLI